MIKILILRKTCSILYVKYKGKWTISAQKYNMKLSENQLTYRKSKNSSEIREPRPLICRMFKNFSSYHSRDSIFRNHPSGHSLGNRIHCSYRNIWIFFLNRFIWLQGVSENFWDKHADIRTDGRTKWIIEKLIKRKILQFLTKIDDKYKK